MWHRVTVFLLYCTCECAHTFSRQYKDSFSKPVNVVGFPLVEGRYVVSEVESVVDPNLMPTLDNFM